MNIKDMRIEELKGMYENAKCCGNCGLKHNKKECLEYDYELTNPVHSGGYCDKYQSDGRTREERRHLLI